MECPSWEELPDGVKCGGDVTDLMVDAIQEAWRSGPEGGLHYPAQYGGCVMRAVFMLTGWHGVKDLNWKVTPPKGKDCASKECRKTLSICGQCLSDSTPANIMFGAMLTACGMSAADIIEWAKWAKKNHANEKDPLPAWDRAAIELGIDLPSNLTEDMFCDALKATGGLQGPDNRICRKAKPCS